jgi:hypothetical protein
MNLTENLRRFVLMRKEDVSGVSGTGKVAEGVVFSNGQAVVCFISPTPSVNVYQSIDAVRQVHGHLTRTLVKFIDSDVNAPGDTGDMRKNSDLIATMPAAGPCDICGAAGATQVQVSTLKRHCDTCMSGARNAMAL